jgi:hypothetical protein
MQAEYSDYSERSWNSESFRDQNQNQTNESELAQETEPKQEIIETRESGNSTIIDFISNIPTVIADLMTSQPENPTEYPCTEMFPKEYGTKNETNKKALKALFQKDSVWKSGTTGDIVLTFGDDKAPGCSPEAAWSLIGNQAIKSLKDNPKWPTMNLGFIDPPTMDDKKYGKSFTLGKDTFDQYKYMKATRNYCTSSGMTSCNADKSKYKNHKNDWVAGSTVIHEFCHALGMLHEHQNNLFNSMAIQANSDDFVSGNTKCTMPPQTSHSTCAPGEPCLDPAAVIKYYKQLTDNNYCDALDMAISNVLTRYSCKPEEGDKCNFEGSVYDPDSIMLYALPDSWIKGPNPTYPNFILSCKDKEWLSREYPMSSTEMPAITVKLTDKNAEPWKFAWVQRTLIDNLLPLIGIVFIFVDEKGSQNVYRPLENPVNPLKDPKYYTKMYYMSGQKNCPQVADMGPTLEPVAFEGGSSEVTFAPIPDKKESVENFYSDDEKQEPEDSEEPEEKEDSVENLENIPETKNSGLKMFDIILLMLIAFVMIYLLMQLRKSTKQNTKHNTKVFPKIKN